MECDRLAVFLRPASRREDSETGSSVGATRGRGRVGDRAILNFVSSQAKAFLSFSLAFLPPDRVHVRKPVVAADAVSGAAAGRCVPCYIHSSLARGERGGRCKELGVARGPRPGAASSATPLPDLRLGYQPRPLRSGSPCRRALGTPIASVRQRDSRKRTDALSYHTLAGPPALGKPLSRTHSSFPAPASSPALPAVPVSPSRGHRFPPPSCVSRLFPAEVSSACLSSGDRGGPPDKPAVRPFSPCPRSHKHGPALVHA